MSGAHAARAFDLAASAPQFDAVVIGAGIAGMYQLYRLRQLNMKVRVFEAGGDVGGTWFWNRYPGARFDSESYTYAYSFSQELLDEWNWSEHFAGQPEALRYLNYVADKFDMRRDIQFESTVVSAVFDDEGNVWVVTLADGVAVTARYLITAIGILTVPQMPRIKGIDTFSGHSFHTARWPKGQIDFSSKRVAVIGTGATGVQVIQTIAPLVGRLTVFQRTPNWCAPLNNSKIEDQAKLKASYPELFARCMSTFGGFLHTPDPRKTFEVSEEEREAFFEQRYAEPGFGIWIGNFIDSGTDPAANAALSNFVARKIRQRVKDPKLAEKLIPKNHGFGTRRVPMETNYYEVYNQDNVELVDTTETPIKEITPHGIRTSEREHEFDIIIYATGFDAITGAFEAIDIRGAGGASLRERWSSGPETYLGILVDGFPNMLMVMGPHSKIGNIPRTIEYLVDWVTGLIQFAERNGYTRIEAKPSETERWHDQVAAASQGLLVEEVDSWLTGVNTNKDGKQKRILARYNGSAVDFRKQCDAIAAGGYKSIRFERPRGFGRLKSAVGAP